MLIANILQNTGIGILDKGVGITYALIFNVIVLGIAWKLHKTWHSHEAHRLPKEFLNGMMILVAVTGTILIVGIDQVVKVITAV